MRSAGENLATLHRVGYAHGHCKWNNLFWDGHHAYLIDLDDARKCRFRGIEQAQDLARFTLNAEELSIGLEIFELFLEPYLQGVEETRREVLERFLPPPAQLPQKVSGTIRAARSTTGVIAVRAPRYCEPGAGDAFSAGT
jgi:hypothetical protein